VGCGSIHRRVRCYDRAEFGIWLTACDYPNVPSETRDLWPAVTHTTATHETRGGRANFERVATDQYSGLWPITNVMPSYFDFIDGADLQRPRHETGGSTSSSSTTAGYSAPNPPSAQQTPSHIVFDTQLLQKMRGCLRSYLGTTKRGAQPVVPNVLATTLDITRQRLVVLNPNLTSEAAAIGFFWMNIVPLVTDFVYDVGGGVAVHLEEAPTAYGAKPDGIWGGGESTSSSSPPGRFFIMPLGFLPSAGQTMGKARRWCSVRRRAMNDPSFLRFSFPYYHGFYFSSNDLSDWHKHGHKGLDLGDSYLRSRLDVFLSTCGTRCERSAPSHSLVF
jgi:hypothetical protein